MEETGGWNGEGGRGIEKRQKEGGRRGSLRLIMPTLLRSV